MTTIAPTYRAQVDLLLQLIPLVAKEKCFALKGGTAINMFIWNMPRLSVDIDLTYIPFDNRTDALSHISNALIRIKEKAELLIPNAQVKPVPQSDGQEAKLLCQSPNAQVKIEVNTIMRGHIFPMTVMDVSSVVEEEFGRFASIQVISQEELFGGKICAALDRQHPRDLFDVSQLFANSLFSNEIKLGFIMAVLSSPRPLHEILSPTLLNQRELFTTQFSGMTERPFTYDDFEEARSRLIQTIHQYLTDQDREFLLSFKNGAPNWALYPIDELSNLPAIRWKQMNIQNLKTKNPNKHQQQLNKLVACLDKMI